MGDKVIPKASKIHGKAVKKTKKNIPPKIVPNIINNDFKNLRRLCSYILGICCTSKF
ncbi:protein of unknown function [Clostridium beijerinckii]|nr:protein of unknown function [Clostridium beijerinckii]